MGCCVPARVRISRSRSVSVETALLFLTLAQPGPLPAYVRTRLGDETESTIRRLVLDGVLEVELGETFASGASAGERLLPTRSEGGRGRIGELSVAALHYGQELRGLDERLLSLRLYCYGRQPISPHLRHRLGDEAAVNRFMGLAPAGKARAAFDAAWHDAPGRRAGGYWRSWFPRRDATRQLDRADIHYKLYASPAVSEVADTLEVTARSLGTARGVQALKVGLDLTGICRPDKIVVYFDRLDSLQEAAARLQAELEGCPAHGVPFTAAISSDGLLSWGADPPTGTDRRGTSWRLWITERLAEYLVLARGSGAGHLPPWRFALERLRLGGVDTDAWIPTSGMWPRATESA